MIFHGVGYIARVIKSNNNPPKQIWLIRKFVGTRERVLIVHRTKWLRPTGLLNVDMDLHSIQGPSKHSKIRFIRFVSGGGGGVEASSGLTIPERTCLNPLQASTSPVPSLQRKGMVRQSPLVFNPHNFLKGQKY